MKDLVAHIPLKDAAFCVNCESIFNMDSQCPACGSQAYVLLENWIQAMPIERCLEAEKR